MGRRCVTCTLSRMMPGVVLTMSATDADGAVNFFTRRRSPGREGDMPSRADRNRLRREVHQCGMATLVVSMTHFPIGTRVRG